MANMWNTKNKKLAISIGMGILGYSALAKLYNFPLAAILENNLIVTAAAAIAIYGIYVLNTEF